LLAGQAAAFFQVEQCHFGSPCLPFAANADKNMLYIHAAMLPARSVKVSQCVSDFHQQLLMQYFAILLAAFAGIPLINRLKTFQRLGDE
jgi:hypothetical protein